MIASQAAGTPETALNSLLEAMGLQRRGDRKRQQVQEKEISGKLRSFPGTRLLLWFHLKQAAVQVSTFLVWRSFPWDERVSWRTPVGKVNFCMFPDTQHARVLISLDLKDECNQSQDTH